MKKAFNNLMAKAVTAVQDAKAKLQETNGQFVIENDFSTLISDQITAFFN